MRGVVKNIVDNIHVNVDYLVLGNSHTVSCAVSLLLARAMLKTQSHRR